MAEVVVLLEGPLLLLGSQFQRNGSENASTSIRTHLVSKEVVRYAKLLRESNFSPLHLRPLCYFLFFR